MLAHGLYHKIVPRSRKENLEFRRRLLVLCDEEPRYRAAVIKMCEADILFFINAFVWQYNPDEFDNENGPFITWDDQEEWIFSIIDRTINQRKRCTCEKSRKMGFTWIALIIDTWLSLFFRDKKFLWISHSEDAIDRANDKDSIFWKIGHIVSQLPSWMSRGARKTKQSFYFPHTKSVINGAAPTTISGVGGRATKITLDEFAKQRTAKEILDNLQSTGPCLVISTHYGSGTYFADLCKDPTEFKVVAHWSKRPIFTRGLYRYSAALGRVEVLDPTYEFPPDYDFVADGSPFGGPFPGVRSPWYDDECKQRRDKRAVAMHLDIDPAGSGSQVFDRETMFRLIQNARDPYFLGDLDYDLRTCQVYELVVSKLGKLRFWLTLDKDGRAPRRKYVVGADISGGSGSSNSCVSVLNAETGEKVMDYATAEMGPETFATLVVAVCKFFADRKGEGAKLIWDRGGPGETFGNRVMNQLYYRNLYLPVNESSLGKRVSDSPGFTSQPANKATLIKDYAYALATGRMTNLSKDSLVECLEFVYEDSGYITHSKSKGAAVDPSGARENHGDRVIADALAWKLAAPIVRENLGETRGESDVPREWEIAPGNDSLAARRKWYKLHRAGSRDDFWRDN